MNKIEKLLLIIAYQLSGERTVHGRRICPLCGMVGKHEDDCELGKMERWVQGELLQLWIKEVKDAKQ